jgi:hypothetical protein
MCLEVISCISCCRSNLGEKASQVSDKLEPYRLHITRLSYGLFLVFGFLLALVGRNGFFGLMEFVPVIRQGCKIVEDQFSTSCAGKNVVYRMSFSLFVFYFIQAFLASRIFFVGDVIRLYLQHKWFILKVPLFLMLCVVPYFIPNTFFIIWGLCEIYLTFSSLDFTFYGWGVYYHSNHLVN